MIAEKVMGQAFTSPPVDNRHAFLTGKCHHCIWLDWWRCWSVCFPAIRTLIVIVIAVCIIGKTGYCNALVGSCYGEG